MTDRTKYDGKLTDALIQTVIEAERRTWIKFFGIGVGDLLADLQQTVTNIVTTAPSCDPQAVADKSGTTNSTTGRVGSKDSIVVDYAAEFDQSRHAVSIEESREQSVGCYERDDDAE